MVRVWEKSVGKARSMKHRPEMSKRGRAPWINKQLIGAAEKGDVGLLLSTIGTFLSEMNLVNISTALHRLAKVATSDTGAQTLIHASDIPSQLAAAATVAIKRCTQNGAAPACQALSNATWSLAALETVDLEFLHIVVTVADIQIALFKPFELSSMLWAFAKLGEQDIRVRGYAMPLFAATAKIIKERTCDFSYRCLIMSAWAFATLGLPDVALFRSISAEIVQSIPATSCSEIAQIAWAFGKAAVRDDDLFSEIAKSATQRQCSFKTQELSDLLWGCNETGFYNTNLFDAATNLGIRLPSNAKDISDEATYEESRGSPQAKSQSKFFETVLNTQLPVWACTVKNTFIEFEDSDTTCPSSDDELSPLTPSLDIIPKDVICPEKLTAYRLEYQRFRAGGALGAKGELCSSVM